MCQVYCPIFLKKGKPIIQDYSIPQIIIFVAKDLIKFPFFVIIKKSSLLVLGPCFLRPAADTSFCVYISIAAVKYITFLFEKIIPKTVKHSYIGNYFVSFQPSFI